MSYLKLIILGFVLLFIGAVLPFIMIIRILESTFLLNFLAAASSISGLTVGFIGIAWYAQSRGRGTD